MRPRSTVVDVLDSPADADDADGDAEDDAAFGLESLLHATTLSRSAPASSSPTRARIIGPPDRSVPPACGRRHRGGTGRTRPPSTPAAAQVVPGGLARSQRSARGPRR